MLNSLVGDLLIYNDYIYILILFNDKNVLTKIFAMHNVHVFLQDHESDVQLLPSPLYVDLLMDLLYMYLRQIVHLKHIMGDSCVGKSCYEWY